MDLLSSTLVAVVGIGLLVYWAGGPRWLRGYAVAVSHLLALAASALTALLVFWGLTKREQGGHLMLLSAIPVGVLALLLWVIARAVRHRPEPSQKDESSAHPGEPD